MITRTILWLVILINPLVAQGLFEDALSDERSESNLNYELNGYIRGGIYLGAMPEKTDYEFKSLYGETSMKLRVRKADFGNAFTEIRLRKAIRSGNPDITAVLREAFVNVYLGAFDLRIGQQIVVWGKADGYNPTNTITPMNLLTFSPDEDDRRESNFVIRSFLNWQTMRLELIWVPVYQPSVLPFSRVKLPEGFQFSAPDYPDTRIEHSAGAFKLHFEGVTIDGSLSYFNGYFPMPGIGAAPMDEITLNIYPTAYRTQSVGADFSTMVGKYGLRGEFAYRKPDKQEKIWQSIPNSQLEYILGIDREIGDFSLILKYIGKHVFDFSELGDSPDEVHQKICLWNRMVFSQLEKWTHSLSFRPAWKLFHEILDVELLGQVNFSTDEIFLKPKISYDLADDLNIAVGAQWYSGPDETLFGEINETLSACFIELKTSF